MSPQSSTPSVPSVLDAADHLRTTAVESFHQFAQGIDGGLGELGGAIRSTIDDHPVRCVLLAAGAGYLLGGGFAAPLTRRLTRLGMRALLIPLVEEPTASFLGWVRSELNSSRFDPSGDAAPSKAPKSTPRSAEEPAVAKGAKSHGT